MQWEAKFRAVSKKSQIKEYLDGGVLHMSVIRAQEDKSK